MEWGTQVEHGSRLRAAGVAWHWTWRTLVCLALGWMLAASAGVETEPTDRVRRYTRQVEFDFVGWTLDALVEKLQEFANGAPAYLNESQRKALVLDYAGMIDEAGRLRQQFQEALSDPHSPDPQQTAAPIAAELEQLQQRQAGLEPLAEAVLQEDVAVVLYELGLAPTGTPLPPVAFRFSRLPTALVVSPRDAIRQDANLQLDPRLTLRQHINLERSVEGALNVSALVVPIGGLSTYPTMVMESSSLDWVTQTVVHEWVHHYLAFRPLGLSYDRSPELRTINETVASILGREIGRQVLERFFPERVPPPPAEGPPPAPGEPPAFDFNAEMRLTRLRVDELLAQGRIEEAEAYMEARRLVFWDHGYRHLRRINQAYFAFYGAYADVPGGAAGEDPAGDAVRALWEQLRDPLRFLRAVAGITSLEELQALVGS
jgi:hypothetical protein